MVTETEGAVGFLLSMRGRLMMARALHYGIKELSKVEGVHREVSDIADMQYLKDELLPCRDSRDIHGGEVMSSMSGSNEYNGPPEDKQGGSILWSIAKFCGLMLGGYWTVQWIISWF